MLRQILSRRHSILSTNFGSRFINGVTESTLNSIQTPPSLLFTYTTVWQLSHPFLAPSLFLLTQTVQESLQTEFELTSVWRDSKYYHAFFLSPSSSGNRWWSDNKWSFGKSMAHGEFVVPIHPFNVHFLNFWASNWN